MGDDEAELIYVYLPGAYGPIDRGELFEDPIDDELRLRKLGEVSGAGTLMGDERPDGSRPVAACGIDVDTDDVDAAREVLRNLLPTLDCPAGTQLHFRRGDTPLQDEYDGSQWVNDRPREMMHPGFGI